jgi:hypothetical protein
MTELAPYLGVEVHVCGLDVCADGELSIVDGCLECSGAPGWSTPLAGLRGEAIPIGPTELPDEADYVLVAGDRLVQIYRDRDKPASCVSLARSAALLGHPERLWTDQR